MTITISTECLAIIMLTSFYSGMLLSVAMLEFDKYTKSRKRSKESEDLRRKSLFEVRIRYRELESLLKDTPDLSETEISNIRWKIRELRGVLTENNIEL